MKSTYEMENEHGTNESYFPEFNKNNTQIFFEKSTNASGVFTGVDVTDGIFSYVGNVDGNNFSFSHTKAKKIYEGIESGKIDLPFFTVFLNQENGIQATKEQAQEVMNLFKLFLNIAENGIDEETFVKSCLKQKQGVEINANDSQ